MTNIHSYFLITFAFFSTVAAYNVTQTNIGVWLSGAAYCGKEQYDKMQIGGPASGFVVNETLYDRDTDVEGFTGVLESAETIYVVLRGSSSVLNWLDDFELRMTSYTSFVDCVDCNVHKGFYKSALAIREKTLDSVARLVQDYPRFNVVVTGHSYGAAVAQLLAMEIEQEGIDVHVYNYGQPRTGDENYAAFVNRRIDGYWRVTHNRDIVPHVPPTHVFGYRHSCREIFEDSVGNLHMCSSTDCEDDECSGQFSLIQTSGSDHKYYLGHRVSCDESANSALSSSLVVKSPTSIF